MKLIDLLVQELPGRGGWPEGALTCAYGEAGRRIGLHFGTGVLGMSRHHKPSIFESYGADSVCTWHSKELEVNQAPEDSVVITRDQYESALAASKQVEWDGEGLPPVGCECEFFNDDYECRDSVPKNGTIVKVVAHQKSKSGIDCAVFTWHGESCAVHAEVCNEYLFRPIRSEAERKREESIKYISHSLRANGSITDEQLNRLYDDIATGNIIGIKLAD